MDGEGHWEYDGEEFCDKGEMWEYALENGYVDDCGFYDWVDDNYNASDILYEISDVDYCESIILELHSSFEQAIYDDAGEPIEGEDYEIADMTFEWVEDEDEDEDEDEEE